MISASALMVFRIAGTAALIIILSWMALFLHDNKNEILSYDLNTPVSRIFGILIFISILTLFGCGFYIMWM